MRAPFAPRVPRTSSRVADTVILLTIALVGVYLVSRMSDPVDARLDSWSEAEVVVSGIGYAASGFTAYAGLAQHQIAPPVDPYFLYANYPVLSNMIYGVLYTIGADAHGVYRLPAILSSLLALWLWYRLVTRVVDQPTAVAATVALASSFGFLSYADNIHQQAYPFAPQLGALLCLAIGGAPETRRRWPWLLGCALCVLLVALLTIELHLWLPIALGGYVLLFGSAVRWRWVVVLALPLCVGVGLQWLQTRQGSPIPPHDRPAMLQSLYRRSIGFADAVDTPLDARGVRISLSDYPGFMARRFREFYGLPVWLLPPLMLFGFAGVGAPSWRCRAWPPQVKLLLLLGAAGLGWLATMMQQTAVHLASLRQLLPFYALLLGVIWTQSLRVAFSDRGSVVWRSVILAIGLSTAIPHVRALLSQRQQEAAGRDEGRELAVLSSLPARSIVLTNHNRVPLIRCWSRRPTYLAPNAAGGGAARGRSWLELNLNYLRTLYPGGMPQLLYLYQLSPITPETVQRALATDAFLRILTTGQDEPLTSPEAQRRAVAAFIGDGPSACPILLRGRDWRCFDMTPIARPLLASFQDYPLPTLKDLPAPR